MNDTLSEPKVPVEFWRTATFTLFALVLTLCGCIYKQDQNAVTKNDLAPIAQSVQTTQQQVQTMSEQFNFLEGQLRAKRVIEK